MAARADGEDEYRRTFFQWMFICLSAWAVLCCSVSQLILQIALCFFLPFNKCENKVAEMLKGSDS